MTSLLSAPPAVIGAQLPRIHSVPPYASSAGEEALELAAVAGLELDPWQQLVVREALGEKPDGSWAAFEVAVVVARQNGKGAILETLELAGLFLLGEQLIVHSAHRYDTSMEAFRRLRTLIKGSDDLSRRVHRVVNSHGEEGIELTSGARIRFRTRASGGGRGFSGDRLILDEAMDIPETAIGDALPTLAAQRSVQVVYAGSVVDQQIHERGLVLARLRERALKGGDPSLAYFEWSPDIELNEALRATGDVEHWRAANPGLGIRITEEHVAREARAMSPRTFAVERLSVGDWPALLLDDADRLTDEDWEACTDPTSRIDGPKGWAIDMRPNRSASAIGVAGARADGAPHVEVIEHRPGASWVVDRAVELIERHGGQVALDSRSPAASLKTSLEARGVTVRMVNATEHAQACGTFYDAATDRRLRHLPQPELAAAVAGAARRPLGEAWAWTRTDSSGDVCPLVAVTLALWAFDTRPIPPAGPIAALI